MSGLSHAAVGYILGLVGVYLIALLINALAPTFGGEKNQMQALKVAAFSFTPAWIAGVLQILPALGILVLLAAIYSLYVLHLGLPVLMKAPKEKAVGYTVVVVLCAIVLAVVFGALANLVGGIGAGSFPGEKSPAVALNKSGEAGDALQKLKQMGDSMEAAAKKMEAANQSGNPQAQAEAAGAVLSAALGGGSQVEPLDQNLLKAMLPDTLANLKRNKLEAEKVAMGEFKIAKAHAGYGDDSGRSVALTVTDAGGASLFGALAAWAMIEREQETDSGYEKMGKVDGRPVHEKFNKNNKDGEYSVVVGNRFLVEARGHQVDMAVLKQAVAAVDLNKLEAMKTAGVKK
jgi:hypothetical protein